MPRLGSPIKPRSEPLPPIVPGCRWIPLTKDKFALVDEQDYEWLSRYCWVYHWQDYAFRKAPVGAAVAQIRMHREILGATDPIAVVDHRNGDGLDNRRSNLRIATIANNNRNNRGRSYRRGPYKGVNPSGRKSKPWAARISVNRRTVNLGRFVTAEEARDAYDMAALRYFGEFAKTNKDLAAPELEQLVSGTLELVTGGRDALRASEEVGG